MGCRLYDRGSDDWFRLLPKPKTVLKTRQTIGQHGLLTNCQSINCPSGNCPVGQLRPHQSNEKI